MYKIIDSIDLNELKMFRYLEGYNPLIADMYYKDFAGGEIKIAICKKTREIYCFTTNFEIKPKLDTFIQDLIRAGLVEKVGE